MGGSTQGAVRSGRARRPRRLRPPASAVELGEDVAQVALDRPLAQEELGGDRRRWSCPLTPGAAPAAREGQAVGPAACGRREASTRATSGMAPSSSKAARAAANSSSAPSASASARAGKADQHPNARGFVGCGDHLPDLEGAAQRHQRGARPRLGRAGSRPGPARRSPPARPRPMPPRSARARGRRGRPPRLRPRRARSRSAPAGAARGGGDRVVAPSTRRIAAGAAALRPWASRNRARPGCGSQPNWLARR